MKARFEELSESQRAGGIEAATCGLVASLADMGVSVSRSSEDGLCIANAPPQIVHFHGIWSPALAKRWHYWRSLGIPCVFSLHGMTEPWALAHKPLKKKVAWHLYQRHILNRASALHATSVREAGNLKCLGLKVPILMIPWGIEGQGTLNNERRTLNTEHSKRTALFVGRIYSVKGLPMLVEAWAKVCSEGWKLMIVGPDEAGHRAELETLVAHYTLGAEIEFTGGLSGDALRKVYREADLFILPSHTENFGMVVGEAMSHGLPVITTHGAPWQLLETERCGWWVPISVEGISRALDDAMRRSPEELSAMGERGRAVVAERFAWDGIARQFVDCYRWILEEGGKPDCVRQF